MSLENPNEKNLNSSLCKSCLKYLYFMIFQELILLNKHLIAVCQCWSLVGTPALQTSAMLDCLVTIKATMNVLQKCKDKVADLRNGNDIVASLLQRFVEIIVSVLKNGKITVFLSKCTPTVRNPKFLQWFHTILVLTVYRRFQWSFSCFIFM